MTKAPLRNPPRGIASAKDCTNVSPHSLPAMAAAPAAALPPSGCAWAFRLLSLDRDVASAADAKRAYHRRVLLVRRLAVSLKPGHLRAWC